MKKLSQTSTLKTTSVLIVKKIGLGLMATGLILYVLYHFVNVFNFFHNL